MGLFDSIFGKKDTPARQLDHPSKLVVGDMVSLDDGFGLPSQLRGQQLRVEGVHTYEYQRSQETEWLLKGNNGDTIFLSLDEDDETYLAFSLKVNRRYIEQMFDMEQFSQIFESDEQVSLDTRALTGEAADQFSPWLAPHYQLVTRAQYGYFHRQDYRGQRPPVEDDANDRGQAFEGYQLLDAEEDHAIDIEVYEDGDTDVLLTVYRPLSDIRDYWPAK